MLEAQLKRLKTDKEREGFRKAAWVIALDEVSIIPNLLRTLCVHRVDIAQHLEKRFGFATGSVRSAGIVAPGSYPEHYKVVTLVGQKTVPPPKNCTHAVHHVDKFDFEGTRAMGNALMHISYIERAVGNPRFAECLMERCHLVTEKLSHVHPAMITRALIDSIVGLSCIRFKELNGCSALNRVDRELPPSFAKYGMGRDVAKVKPSAVFDRETEIEVKTMRFSRGVDSAGKKQYEEHVLVVTIRGGGTEQYAFKGLKLEAEKSHGKRKVLTWSSSGK
jgi:hypothetical protein